MSALARCRGVSVVYGDGAAAVAALDGVDLEVGEGERLALLGRSGSGKTTLLHVLGGLVEPTSGEVELDTERPAFVFQSANLLPHFTAYENVAFAAYTAHGGRRSELLPQGLLELVGLTDKLDRLPAELSGGEAQRVALARALAQSPRLLLCDEPTGHLDSDTSARVLSLLDALQEAYGFALVVATHDPGVASRLDREVELRDGRVVDAPVAA
ncbi:MAG: ABC transporter ATP-binding protein [Actinomycetota bacterium]|nr:ABC transporter ATP-binding protein [Actinomycetota bacterium]